MRLVSCGICADVCSRCLTRVKARIARIGPPTTMRTTIRPIRYKLESIFSGCMFLLPLHHGHVGATISGMPASVYWSMPLGEILCSGDAKITRSLQILEGCCAAQSATHPAADDSHARRAHCSRVGLQTEKESSHRVSRHEMRAM